MNRLEDFIENFIKALKNKELVGIELMDILKNNELVDEIHKSAIKIITNYHQTRSKTSKFTVFASLILISIENYSGNFWDPTHNTYLQLSSYYNIQSRQNYESVVREMISEFYIGPAIQTRKINWLLMQSVVPSHYLFDYFDMMLEVYTYDLRATLPEDDLDLDEVMNSIVGQISRKNYSTEDKFQSKISNQAYRLIQSTRDAMKSKIYRRSVVKFSRNILRVIDQYVQNRLKDSSNESYISLKVDEWFSEKGKSRYDALRRHIHSGKNRKSISWKPTFILRDQKLYLVTRTIFLSEDIDFKQIKIRIQSDQKDVYVIDNPEILSDDGLSAELSSNEIQVNFSPFNLTIKIEGLDIPDYDLINEFLVFNDKGKMVKGVSDKFDKKYYIISNDLENTNTQLVGRNQYYVLSYFDAGLNEFLILNDKLIPTKYYENITLSGEKYDNVYLQVGEKHFEIFKDNVSVIIPNDNRYLVMQVWINNHLKNIRLSGQEIDNYIVSLDDLDLGLNNIKFLDQNSQPFENQDNFIIFIDNNLCYEYNIIDKKVVVIYTSTFTNGEKKAIEWPLEQADYIYDTIEVENISIRFVFRLNIPMYKKENATFKLFPDYLYHSDFGFYEKLTIKGINASILSLIGEDYQTLLKIDSNKTIEGNIFTFDIGILKTAYRDQNIRLDFSDNEHVIYTIDYLNYITFESQEFIITPKPIEGSIDLSIGHMRGKGNVEIQLKNYETLIESVVFSSGQIQHNFKVSTSPAMFTIKVIDLSKNILIHSKTIYYYTKYDLLHVSYRIKEVALGINKKLKKGLEYIIEYNDGMDYLRNIYVKLQSYNQQNNSYIGKLYFINKSKIKEYFRIIENVKLEIPYLIENPKEITALMYIIDDEYDDQVLFYDRKSHRILDLIDDPDDYYEICTIDEILMEKVEKRHD
jgi:hypothetical protein